MSIEMKGYRFAQQYNGTYAFRERPTIPLDKPWQRMHQELLPDMSGASRPGVMRCAACGDLLDKWNESLEGIRIKRRRYDLSTTYDSVDIASERFRQFIEEQGIGGLEFRPLPDDPDFYSILPRQSVAYDPIAGKTRFLNPCPVCHRYEAVLGQSRVFLKEGEVVPARGFVRSDLEFGNNDCKSSLLLCGVETGRLLKASKLKGVVVLPLSHLPS